MMTSEEIYDLVAYYMKDDAGMPYRYDELSFEQRTFVDALVENFESDAEETISSLELTITDLERELIESEIECRKLRKELVEHARPLV
tara:strand:- start:1358 stop:1621 length:264 start_codon:yes stop_codon:yes gene_type:complete